MTFIPHECRNCGHLDVVKAPDASKAKLDENDEMAQLISHLRGCIEYLLAAMEWIYKEDKEGLLGAKAKTSIKKISPNHEILRG